ncbi:hypothetical protein [Microvirga tunisiensis]|nr:hypothetical protein [Microvirga tunisiensis]
MKKLMAAATMTTGRLRRRAKPNEVKNEMARFISAAIGSSAVKVDE